MIEIRRLQHGKVLAHRLARHVQPRAQLAQRLAVALVQAVEQEPPARIGQRPEDLVHGQIGSHLAAYNTQPVGCLSSCQPSTISPNAGVSRRAAKSSSSRASSTIDGARLNRPAEMGDCRVAAPRSTLKAGGVVVDGRAVVRAVGQDRLGTVSAFLVVAGLKRGKQRRERLPAAGLIGFALRPSADREHVRTGGRIPALSVQFEPGVPGHDDRSSSRPAQIRDHWTVGRPSRRICAPLESQRPARPAASPPSSWHLAHATCLAHLAWAAPHLRRCCDGRRARRSSETSALR